MVIQIRKEDSWGIASEAGVIATLFLHPEYWFYSEYLLPNHFGDKQNRCVYTAIQMLVKSGIEHVDAYNIVEILNSKESTKHYADEITIQELQEFEATSKVLARDTVEEYKVLVANVMNASFRRDIIRATQEAQRICSDMEQENIEQRVYDLIDGVMTEYSTANDIPQFKDVVDDCWTEIQDRQRGGYAGIPFKFPTLNEYATIERGELFIFAAEAKQGKSMMLLNCAVDLLKRDLSVLYIDSELNTRLFTARLLSHLTGIEYKRLTSGNYNGEEDAKIKDAIAWLKTRKLTHIYLPMFDQQTIYTAVKKVYHTMGLDVLIVD